MKGKAMKIFVWFKGIREHQISLLKNLSFMERKIKLKKTNNENNQIMNQSDFFQNNLKS